MSEMTTLYIQRSNKVLTRAQPKNIQTPVTDAHIVTALKNIESLGYVFSSALITELKKYELLQFTKFINELITVLKKLKGAHVRHNPMYPNFPQQVAEASDTELYINAFMHYFGDWLGARILPEYEKEDREALDFFKPLQVLDLGSEEDFNKIFTTLLSSKSGFSTTDVTDIEWFLKNRNESVLIGLLPDEIPNKENLAHVTGLLYTQDKITLFLEVLNRTQTATDVLRVYVKISNGDPSLGNPHTRLVTIPRSLRKAFLNRLEAISTERPILEDMLRWKSLWKIAGEKLHPGEQKNLTQVNAAFNHLRNNLPFLTFNGRVQKLVEEGKTYDAAVLLQARPGVFARQLDSLLRAGKDETDILDRFEEVATNVATPVLWQMREHFLYRATSGNKVRAFFPKGQVSKVQIVENMLTVLDKNIVKRTVDVIDTALENQYGTKESLGKVWVDPQLQGYAIPTSVRSTNRTLNTVGRGSHVPYDAKENLRLFIWWTDGAYRTDLDLSVIFLNKDYKAIGSVSYTNLRCWGAVHSGDITSAPNGASEYVDLPIENLKSFGVRYVVMAVNSYTNQPFYELPECFAGVMSRDSAQKGEVYEPRTLEKIFDLTSDTKVAMPLILDLEESEIIWTDVSLKSNSGWVNNIHANSDNLTELAHVMVTLHRANLQSLFTAHAVSRGELVTNKADADVVFEVENGKVNVNAEEILANYL